MIYVVFQIENDKTQENTCGNNEKELMPRPPQISVDDSGYDVKNKMASAVLTLAATSASTSKRRLSTLKHVQTVNEKRRSFEDNLAKIFLGFVFVFLICHTPRLFLNIHELIVMEEAMKCQSLRQEPFSLWSLLLINVSHFLLVLNSSTNILVYCFMSSKFRDECKKFQQQCKSTSCCKLYEKDGTASLAHTMKPRRAQTINNPFGDSNNYVKQHLTAPTKSVPLSSKVENHSDRQ